MAVQMDTIYIDRVNKAKKEYIMSNRKKSAEVWGARYRNAAKLAKCDYFNGDEDAALNLILRTIRWSLRRAHQWEKENTNEEYAASKKCSHDEALIEAYGNRLSKEWAACGYAMKFYGLYPTIESVENNGDTIYLSYFD